VPRYYGVIPRRHAPNTAHPECREGLSAPLAAPQLTPHPITPTPPSSTAYTPLQPVTFAPEVAFTGKVTRPTPANLIHHAPSRQRPQCAGAMPTSRSRAPKTSGRRGRTLTASRASRPEPGCDSCPIPYGSWCARRWPSYWCGWRPLTALSSSPRQLQLGAVCGDLLLRLALCGLGGTAVGQIGEADGDAGGRLQTWAADFASDQWRNCCTALETGSGMTKRPTVGVQALKVPVIVRDRVKALGSPSSVSLSPVASQVASPLVGRPGQSHDQDRSCPIGQERS